MKDSPTPEHSGDDVSATPPFRMPTGAPDGTLARGALAASEPPAEPTSPEPISLEKETAQEVDSTPETEPEPEEDWTVGTSADGRPIESPYTDETANDENALAYALLSEDARNSPGYNYPMEPSSNFDFSSIQTSVTEPLDDPADPIYDDYDELETPPDMALDVPHEDYSDHQLATSADNGAVPPSIPTSTSLEHYDENAPANDREMGLMEHLGELRTRIMWCVGAILVAMIATWQYAPQLEALIIAPVKTALKQAGQKDGQIIVISPTEGFMLQFNISLIAALVITAPFLLFQIWKFVEPAMTKNERRFTGILVPFSSLLFFMGCGLAYVMSPLFFAFFAMFVPPGTLANWSFAESAVLLAKMLLICGICFQVPVFTIFLNKSGIVSRNVLIEYWRHVVVVIFIVVAILTPTWDPVSLMVCALPPCFLYALSIWLVKWL